MLITTVREFTHEVGEGAICQWCYNVIFAPPVIFLREQNKAVYHVGCMMQLVYSVLTDITGHKPEEKAPESTG